MKSLEIVNDKIAELKDTYQHYTAVEKDKAKSSFAKFDIEQFQQIKQDLERLELLEKAIEIIKKPKNKDGLYTAFYDGVGVNEQEEEILTKVIEECEDDD